MEAHETAGRSAQRDEPSDSVYGEPDPDDPISRAVEYCRDHEDDEAAEAVGSAVVADLTLIAIGRRKVCVNCDGIEGLGYLDCPIYAPMPEQFGGTPEDCFCPFFARGVRAAHISEAMDAAEEAASSPSPAGAVSEAIFEAISEPSSEPEIQPEIPTLSDAIRGRRSPLSRLRDARMDQGEQRGEVAMAMIVNKQGSSEKWSADVLHGGVFAARLSVSTQDSVQTVRLRRMVEGRTTRSVLAEWKSPAARPWGMDAIEDMVEAALDGERTRVLIVVEDGLIAQVQASDPEAVDVIVIDLDAEGDNPDDQSSIENPFEGEAPPGEKVQAYVSRWTDDIRPLTRAAADTAADHFGPA